MTQRLSEPAFVVIPLAEGERKVPLGEGNTWKLGRNDENNIVLPSEWVSRQHALMQRTEGGEYYLIDMGSRNGTFVNGARVTVPMTLHDGDRISFGDYHITFHCPALAPVKPPPQRTPDGMATVTYFASRKTTVLVVDVRGFTKIAQIVDASLLSQVIGTWFRRGGEIMTKQGSWGQKYIGDALMSVWVHKGENWERQIMGILGALTELVEITSGLQGQFGLPMPISIGAGINTGAASVGNAGGDQFSDHTALGDTVNAAFRFESATRDIGFDLVIGQETMACLRKCANPEHFFRERTVQLKGYERPTNVWAVSFGDLRKFVEEVPKS
jgi:adenylate cyclase